MKQLITMCSYCKKYQEPIIDMWYTKDQILNVGLGKWLQAHEITHGICPDCYKKQAAHNDD